MVLYATLMFYTLLGLVHDVVPHSELMDRAQAQAEQWVRDKKIRSIIQQNRVQEVDT